MRASLIVCAALLAISIGQNTRASSEASSDEWIEVQSPSWGGWPASEPEDATEWQAEVQMGNHPWVRVADLEDHQDAFDTLRGERTLQDVNQIEILIKGKVTTDPSYGDSPVVWVGWMRELLPGDSDWRMPWQVNLPLIPWTDDADTVSHIVSTRAAGAADSLLSYSGVQNVGQDFEVLETFYGEPLEENVRLQYSYTADFGRDVKQDENVIWILTAGLADEGLRGYGAIADTPNNRRAAIELAKRLKGAAIATVR